MSFVYSSGRRYGAAPRIFQVRKDGSVRVAVCMKVVAAQETVQTFPSMDAFIAALGTTTKEQKKKLKRRKKKNGRKKNSDT